MGSKHNIFDEDPRPLREAAGLMPLRNDGTSIHHSTLFRWAQIGIRGIRLETLQVGGTKMTSRAALDRFFQALTDARQASHTRENVNA